MYWEPETYRPEELVEYLRKSRSDDPLLSVEEVLQRHETILADWQERFLDGGRIPLENIYREVVSGETIAGRPEFMKLLRRLESPSIKAVLVVEVQRMSRGDLEDAGRLIKILRYTNTKVITPMHTYNLNDEYDRDAFERELKRGNDYLEYSKRIMGRGRLQSVMDGYFVGSRPPFGYNRKFITIDKKRRPVLEINEEEAKVVRLIFDMYAYQNIGFREICTRLDALGIKPPKSEHWHPETLKDMLGNDHYIGKIRWNWRKTVKTIQNLELVSSRPKSNDYLVVDGKHEPIIDETTFRTVQEKRGRYARKSPAVAMRNPFSSLLFCRCGYCMSLQTYSRAAPRLVCTNQHHCSSASASFAEVYEAVCAELQKAIADFEFKLSATDETVEQIQKEALAILQRKYDDACKKEISLWEKYAEDRMPKNVFDNLRQKAEKEKEALATEIENSKNLVTPRSAYEDRIAVFSEALAALRDNDVSIEQKNNFLKTCLQRITYYREPSVRMTREEAAKRGVSAPSGWYNPPFELDITLRF